MYEQKKKKENSITEACSYIMKKSSLTQKKEKEKEKGICD